MVRLQSPKAAQPKSGSGTTPRLPRHTLAVIDAGVDDYQHLVAGVAPGIKVLVLDPGQDGIEQITQALKTDGNINTLYIMAHGAPGCLMLGNTQLSLDTIDRYAWDLTSWFPSSRNLPTMLLYACQVAAGEMGSTFLEKLRHLTEAEIAASTTPIGKAELGGNWKLDVTTGTIEVLPAFQPGILESYPAILNKTYHKLSTGSFTQYWTEAGLITAADDWSGVPSIVGHRGDGLTIAPGTDPQTIVADGTSTPVDVIEDQNSPNSLMAGGVAEFAIANPTIALQGSGTADAPFLLIHLDTTEVSNVQISYKLRDLDSSSNNAVSRVALQYRIGEAGDFINLPAGYVADASTGSAATQVTPVMVTLPSSVDNQSKVQLRIITADAAGSDEWIGIDDINVTATKPNQAPILTGNATLTALSEDGDITTNTGSKVTDLISGLVTDANADPQAIAVTGVDNSNGIWQYSTNGGANWTDFGNTLSDSNAVILGATSLYNAPLGTAPDNQGWLALVNVVGATQTVNGGGTVLDTTANSSIYAGYSNFNNGTTPVSPNFPILDNEAGYSISFNLQMLAESRTNQSRAGFSIVVTSNNATKAIELGFQRTSNATGNIFAQSPTFAATENVAYNTNLATDYTLKVAGNSYQLLANGTEILTGSLRDYSSFTGAPDPYEQPNFIFLGDDTTSAQGRFNLSQVVVQTDTRVRFLPNLDYNGTANFSFRAWDTTNGLANSNAGVNVSMNGGATAYSATVGAASVTVNPINDAPKGNVVIDGTAQENQTLTVNSTGLSDADGLGTLNYQWQSGDGAVWTDIAGATNSSFTPTNLQVGSFVRVRLTYTDQQGTLETVDSSPTSTIADDASSGSLPPPVVPPIESKGENANPNQSPPGGQNNLGSSTTPANAVIIETEGAIREASTNQVTIRFSETVSNFDLSDLILLRDGAPVSLTEATLTTTDNITWTLSNIGSLTTVDGRYQLTLKQSNITNLAGTGLSRDVATTWLVGHTGIALPQIRFNNGKSLGMRRLGDGDNNRLVGTPFNDILKGGSGDDLIISGFGKAQFGVDRLTGGEGNDRLISGRGNDILDSGSGNDQVKAGKGNDLLQGGAGNDRLIGNAGQDVVVGGAGDDRLTGGSGGDTFVYRLSDGTDTITDFENADLLDLRPIFAESAFSGANAFARFIEFVSVEQVQADVKVSVDSNGNESGKNFLTIAVLQNTTMSQISANNFLIA